MHIHMCNIIYLIYYIDLIVQMTHSTKLKSEVKFKIEIKLKLKF